MLFGKKALQGTCGDLIQGQTRLSICHYTTAYTILSLSDHDWIIATSIFWASLKQHFQQIEHNLLGTPGVKLKDIKEVFSHQQALSQCSSFIKKNNINENVRADTAGSAELVSKSKNKNHAAIASKLSAKIYKLDVLEANIENEKGNATRFLLMGKKVLQPEFKDNKYITSFLFKLKSKPAALYQALGGFAINGVNLTKLQSYPEKNSFNSYFFLCDLDGHIDDPKVQKSLEELGLHCEDFHVLGVFLADKFREK